MSFRIEGGGKVKWFWKAALHVDDIVDYDIDDIDEIDEIQHMSCQEMHSTMLQDAVRSLVRILSFQTVTAQKARVKVRM